MDMSKLPRLSNTQETQNQQKPADVPVPPPQIDSPQTAVPARPIEAATFGGAEVWLSAALGLLFMYLGRMFAMYLFATLHNQPFHTGVTWLEGPKEGTEVRYFELSGFTALTDAGIFLFGLTMVIEAIAMVTARRSGTNGLRLVALALAVTVGATLFNLFVALKLFGAGVTPIISMFAVAFGGYIAMYQWGWLNSLRAKRV